jgi:site-specific DNA recombinase
MLRAGQSEIGERVRKAIIYIRVSTQEQLLNHSLDTQERACREYCRREGWQVSQVYRERGESAKTMQRTALTELLEFCKKHARKDGVGALVVYKVDRLARDAFDHHIIRYELQKSGVILRSVQEPIDETPEGLLMENLVAAFAQFDNDSRARRTRDGMLAALRMGRWMWNPPLGYLRPESPDGPSLRLDPERHFLIRTAFELVAHGGLTRAEAHEAVTAEGLRGRSGGKLTTQRFNALLANPIYYGQMHSPSLDFTGPGDFDPIVSRELFDLTQRMSVKSNKGPYAAYRLDNPDFPLRRVLKCSECGGALTASWSTGRRNKYGYYRCPAKGCRMNVAAERVHRDFEQFLMRETVNESVFDLFAEVLVDAWQDRVAVSQRREQSLLKRLDTIEMKRSKLVDALVFRSVIGRDEFDAQAAELDIAADAVREELAQVAPAVVDIDSCREIGRHVLTDLAGTWRRLRPDSRPAFARVMYPAGLIYSGCEIGTGATPWYAPQCGVLRAENELEVPPTGFEPV